jgi:DNA-binding NarL/FixJ family response regulator
VVEEIPWLHEMNSTTETTPVRCKLPPRQQATLVLLIQGWSYKAIAAHLHVSPHTVQEYIKCIYRSFGINSRAGLIKQLALRGP